MAHFGRSDPLTMRLQFGAVNTTHPSAVPMSDVGFLCKLINFQSHGDRDAILDFYICRFYPILLDLWQIYFRTEL